MLVLVKLDSGIGKGCHCVEGQLQSQKQHLDYEKVKKHSEGTLPRWLSRPQSGSPTTSCHWTEHFHSGPKPVCLCRSSNRSNGNRGEETELVALE